MFSVVVVEGEQGGEGSHEPGQSCRFRAGVGRGRLHPRPVRRRHGPPARRGAAGRTRPRPHPDGDDVPVLLAVSDNGPQMTSRATAAFMAAVRIGQHFGRPEPRTTRPGSSPCSGTSRTSSHTSTRSATQVNSRPSSPPYATAGVFDVGGAAVVGGVDGPSVGRCGARCCHRR